MRPTLRLVRDGEPVVRSYPLRCGTCYAPLSTREHTHDPGTRLVPPHRCDPPRDALRGEALVAALCLGGCALLALAAAVIR